MASCGPVRLAPHLAARQGLVEAEAGQRRAAQGLARAAAPPLTDRDRGAGVAPARIPAATVARSSRRAPAKARKASGSSAKTALSRLIPSPLVASEVPTSNHASQHSMVPMSISSRIRTWRCRQIAHAVAANAASRNTSKFTQTARQ